TLFGQLAWTISRHRKAAILFFLVVFGLVTAATLLTRKSYISQAKLFVRLGRENVALDPTTTFGQGPVVAIPPTRENELNTVIESLHSRPLIEKIVDQIGPAVILDQAAWQPGGKAAPSDGTDPQVAAERYRAILVFLRNLDVRSAKRSNVIEISYQAS